LDQNSKLIWTGAAGAALSLLCCATPVLAVLLGAVGLTAFAAKLDYVLIPVFIASLALVIFALLRRRRSCAAKTRSQPS
jgi:mercuric ion transport protein